MTAYSQISESEIISLLVEDVFELSGALRRVGQVIAKAEGQTHARWQLLNAASGGGMTVAQLAKRLGLARQSVQHMSDVLVSERLLTYKDNPSHRRSPHVELTAGGRRVLKRLTNRSRRFRDLVAKKTSKRGLGNLREGIVKLSDTVASIERDKRLVR